MADAGPRHDSAEDEISRLVEAARDVLEMDAVYISQFRDGKQVFRAVGGDVSAFDLTAGDDAPLDETYCKLMVDGSIPRVIPDSAANALVRDLPITQAHNVGAYVGVPLRLSDSSLYGTLCCISSDAKPDLRQRDAKILDMFASMIVGRIERDLDAELVRAGVEDVLAAGSVQIALQPIASLVNNRWCGVEALARFSDGTPPDRAFAAAHDVGLGAELEVLALTNALAVLPQLPGQLHLAVNMSPATILHAGFLHAVSKVPVERLTLEITEHAQVELYADLVSVLSPLRLAGLKVAVDDVGAGYSSFRHVLQLQPDVIKIDRSLIDGIADDPVLRAIAHNIVLLASDLSAEVVAEGVERAEDLAAAAEIGAHMAQGYLLGRPSTDPPHSFPWWRQAVVPASDDAGAGSCAAAATLDRLKSALVPSAGA